MLLLSSTDLVCVWTGCACGVHTVRAWRAQGVRVLCLYAPGAQHGPARQRRRGHGVEDPDAAVLELAQHLGRQLHLRGALHRRRRRPRLGRPATRLYGALPLARSTALPLALLFARFPGRLTRLDKLAVVVVERDW